MAFKVSDCFWLGLGLFIFVVTYAHFVLIPIWREFPLR